MPKPPETPPHSDIDGVREDQRRVDLPENATPDPGAALHRSDADSKARPDSTDHRSKQ